MQLLNADARSLAEPGDRLAATDVGILPDVLIGALRWATANSRGLAVRFVVPPCALPAGER